MGEEIGEKMGERRRRWSPFRWFLVLYQGQVEVHVAF